MPSRIFDPLEDYAKWLKHGRFRVERIDVKDGVVMKITVELGPGIFKSWTLADVQHNAVSLVE